MVRVKRLSVEIGYLEHSLTLTDEEWRAVCDGTPLTRSVQDLYEGETWTYTWHLKYPNLLITCDESVGFDGAIEDADLEDVDIADELLLLVQSFEAGLDISEQLKTINHDEEAITAWS